MDFIKLIVPLTLDRDGGGEGGREGREGREGGREGGGGEGRREGEGREGGREGEGGEGGREGGGGGEEGGREGEREREGKRGGREGGRKRGGERGLGREATVITTSYEAHSECPREVYCYYYIFGSSPEFGSSEVICDGKTTQSAPTPNSHHYIIKLLVKTLA